MMGCDARLLLTIKQVTDDHYVYSEPRGRKKYALNRIIETGVILLRGHHPRGSGHKVFETEGSSFIMDGKGGRFAASETEGGIDGLLDYLKPLVVCHTLDRCKSLRAVWSDGETRQVGNRERDIRQQMIALPGHIVLDIPAKLPSATRQPLLTERERKALLAAGDSDRPIVKIFNPAGAQTWLLCSLGEDQDTLWGYADLGLGVVEFGAVSLEELESTIGPFGMRLERDRYFNGCDLKMKELLGATSIPSNLKKSTSPNLAPTL